MHVHSTSCKGPFTILQGWDLEYSFPAASVSPRAVGQCWAALMPVGTAAVQRVHLGRKKEMEHEWPSIEPSTHLLQPMKMRYMCTIYTERWWETIGNLKTTIIEMNHCILIIIHYSNIRQCNYTDNNLSHMYLSNEYTIYIQCTCNSIPDWNAILLRYSNVMAPTHPLATYTCEKGLKLLQGWSMSVSVPNKTLTSSSSSICSKLPTPKIGHESCTFIHF